MVGVTDIPGRRSPDSAVSGSSTIFTGMRCTILVKLPVALSGGSKRELLAAGRSDAVDVPVRGLAGECVDFDLDRLTRLDVGELGLLVIGDDVGIRRRHHGHQLGAGLNELPDAKRAVADHPVHGRHDRGVAEIQLGLALNRKIMRRRGLGLCQLGLEQADLLGGGGKRRRVALHAGGRRGDPRGRLLRILRGAEAGRRQIRVTLVFLLGEFFVGAVDRQRGVGALDDGLLDVE